MEAAANANSSSSIPRNYVTLKRLKENHDASIMEMAADANSSSSSSSIPNNYVTLKQLKEKHDASITEKADMANSSSIPNNYVTLKQLKEEHDASIMETAAKVNSSSSSSIPKNYVSLKHLQELRLKEKHDEEERLRNLNREADEKKAAEERRKADESLIPKPHRRTLGSGHKWPSNRQEWVVARLAPPRIPDAVGAKGSASGDVQVPPIGKSTGCDSNPEVGRKQDPKKKKKKKRGKAAREKNGEPEAAMATAEEESEEIKGSEKITADPSQENPVQIKEDGRRGRWTRAVYRPMGRLSGCGQERTVPTERRSVIVDDEAAAGAGRGRLTAARGGASNQRAGGFGRGRRSPDGAGLVWVRKTSST